MDTARVLEDSGSSRRRPRRRGRWIVAAALACLAAPLASGSAIAVSGSSGGSSAIESGGALSHGARPAQEGMFMQRDKKHRCRHGEQGGSSRRGSSYAPEL